MKKIIAVFAALTLFASVCQAEIVTAPPGVQGPASAVSGHIATFGASGNIIQDGGAAPTGTVTSVVCGAGLSGGTITTTGTCGFAGGPLWSVNLTTTSQALSGTTLMHFNTKLYDTATVCDVASTFVCTPNLAGFYMVTCAAAITQTTGPAVGGVLGSVQINKNGANSYKTSIEAQALALAAPDVFPSVSGIIQVNGTTDTLSCSAATSGTGTTTLDAITSSTYMIGAYVHS